MMHLLPFFFDVFRTGAYNVLSVAHNGYHIAWEAMKVPLDHAGYERGRHRSNILVLYSFLQPYCASFYFVLPLSILQLVRKGISSEYSLCLLRKSKLFLRYQPFHSILTVVSL
eukprot:IDg11396t1